MTGCARIPGFDAARGVVLLLIAFDTCRDSIMSEITLPRGLYHTSPPLSITEPWLYVTRWLANIAAPGLFIIVGCNLMLHYFARKERRWSNARIVRKSSLRALIIVGLSMTLVLAAWVCIHTKFNFEVLLEELDVIVRLSLRSGGIQLPDGMSIAVVTQNLFLALGIVMFLVGIFIPVYWKLAQNPQELWKQVLARDTTFFFDTEPSPPPNIDEAAFQKKELQNEDMEDLLEASDEEKENTGIPKTNEPWYDNLVSKARSGWYGALDRGKNVVSFAYKSKTDIISSWQKKPGEDSATTPLLATPNKPDRPKKPKKIARKKRKRVKIDLEWNRYHSIAIATAAIIAILLYSIDSVLLLTIPAQGNWFSHFTLFGILFFPVGSSVLYSVWYPIVNWLAIMIVGMMLGHILARKERRLFGLQILLGVSAVCLLVAPLFRMAGWYFNLELPGADVWQQSTYGFFWLIKYPPSFTYFIVSFGIHGIVMSSCSLIVDHTPIDNRVWEFVRLLFYPLLCIGKSWIFFYVSHLWMFGIIGLLVREGDVADTVLFWFLGVIPLTVASVYYSEYKTESRIGSLWRMF